MSFIFGGAPAGAHGAKGSYTKPVDMVTQCKLEVRKADRSLVRDGMKLDQREKELSTLIKRSAREGKLDACQSHAKTLVRTRQHKAKLTRMRAQLENMSQRLTEVKGAQAMHDTVSTITGILTKMNKTMLTGGKLSAISADFERQNSIMSDAMEVMDDSIEAAFEADDEVHEVDAAMSQVLQELGVDALLEGAKVAQGLKSMPTQQGETIEERLARLKVANA
jgi:division protein CdvB (Snf7/Vps24/ESCRT-III family)